MRFVAQVKGENNLRELTKDVPTLRLLLKAGVDEGFRSFTSAYLSGRDRISSLKLVEETAKIEDIILKSYGFDVIYTSSEQMGDFWTLFKNSCNLVSSVELKVKNKSSNRG